MANVTTNYTRIVVSGPVQLVRTEAAAAAAAATMVAQIKKTAQTSANRTLLYAAQALNITNLTTYYDQSTYENLRQQAGATYGLATAAVASAEAQNRSASEALGSFSSCFLDTE